MFGYRMTMAMRSKIMSIWCMRLSCHLPRAGPKSLSCSCRLPNMPGGLCACCKPEMNNSVAMDILQLKSYQDEWVSWLYGYVFHSCSGRSCRR